MKTYIWSVITTIVIVDVAFFGLYILLDKKPVTQSQQFPRDILRTQRDITVWDIAGLYNIYCFKIKLPEDCRKNFRIRLYAQKGNNEPQLINNIFYVGPSKEALQKIIVAQLENGIFKFRICGMDTYFSPGFDKEKTKINMSYNPEIQPDKIFYKIRTSGNTNYGNDFYNLKENEYVFFYRIDPNTLNNK